MMSQYGPVTAGDISLFERFEQKFPHLHRIGGLRKAPDRCLVTIIQRLVQQFPDKIVPLRQRRIYPDSMIPVDDN